MPTPIKASEIRFCTKCLYPSTALPTIEFDSEGVCSGCRAHETRKKINWDQQEEELKTLIKKIKSEQVNPPLKYDCVIGVSGGKDSHFQVYYAKEILKLNPLLVTFNHLDNSAIGLKNLQNLLDKFDTGHVRLTPNIQSTQKLMRWSLKSIGEFLYHEHLGIYTVPTLIAAKFKIPIILWGEYGFGDMLGIKSEGFVTTDNVVKYGLRGRTKSEFLKHNDEGLSDSDFIWGEYPNEEELSHIKSIYLGDFINWDQVKQTDMMIEKYGFRPKQSLASFNSFENAETEYNDSVHDFGKYLRAGYMRAVDHASLFIRLGYINRTQGLELIRPYCDLYSMRTPELLHQFNETLMKKLKQFCRKLNLSVDQFFEYTKKYSKWELDNRDIYRPLLDQNTISESERQTLTQFIARFKTNE